MLWFHAISLLDGSTADGVHLLWAPPTAAGYSELGWELWRRPARRAPRAECDALTSTQLATLHSSLGVEVPAAVVSVRVGAVPEPDLFEIPDEPLDGGELVNVAAAIRPVRRPETPWTPRHGDPRSAWSPARISMLAAVAAPRRAVVYTIELASPARRVRVEIGAQTFLGVGLREGKAVTAIPPVVGGAGVAVFSFDAAPVDSVVIYALSTAKSLKLCPEGPREDQFESSDATLLASGIQLPFACFDPTLTEVREERARAHSRLLPGEILDSKVFERLSRIMNTAGASKDRFSPVYMSSFSRERVGDPFVESPAFRCGLGLTVDPSWRRALGFGYFDEGAGLTPGGFYDYRLVGWFFRRDLDERTIGFHTIPLGLTLPGQCDLGGIRLETRSPLIVSTPSGATPDSLEFMGRKGVALRGRLTLRLPEPIVRLILEFEVGEAHALEFRAHGDGGSLRSSTVVCDGSVAREPRVELEFPAPVDRVELMGEAFLYAIRASSIGPGEDPEQLIRVVQDIYAVRYAPTPAPAPPPALGTVNLHAPQSPNKLGFGLRWLPPTPAGSVDPKLWPPDLAAALPCDGLSFEIERRRVDTGEPFRVIAKANASVNRRTSAAEPLRWGDELLEHYPEEPRVSAPVSVLMEYDDVLTSPGGEGPEPGSLVQYRITSIDLLGRRSTPTHGSIVRLEKRRTPPMPGGVDGRVLQAGAHLSADDRARLAGHDSAIVLRWDWTEEQRRADPYARTFRIYFMAKPPDAVGTELGPADWYERCAVVPITAEPSYEHVFFDRLHPSPDQPRPRVWVGVSAADDQPYVPDERSSGPFGGRPGNESAIVAVEASARWRGKPLLSVPAPLPAVPNLLFAEVPGETTSTVIDFPGLIPVLPRWPGLRYQLERVSGASLVAMLSARNDGQIAAEFPDETSETYVLSDPDDHARLLAQIRMGQPARIANRFLLDLVIRFQHRFAPLWQPIGGRLLVDAPARDVVANTPERWFYRVSSVDEAGHVSEGIAIVPRVYRVPSAQAPPPPRIELVAVVDGTLRVAIEVADWFELAGVLVFTSDEVASELEDRPTVLRVPDRPDLYPRDGIRLRKADGGLLRPTFFDKSEAAIRGGVARFEILIASGDGRRAEIWVLAVTRDGVVSAVVGPQISE